MLRLWGAGLGRRGRIFDSCERHRQDGWRAVFMKVRDILFLLSGLIAGFGLILAGRLTAQTFTVLHTFTSASGSNATNSDGANPSAGLVLSGNTLYGTAKYGGGSGWGTVFAVNTDGTVFMAPYNFTGGSDGGNP